MSYNESLASRIRGLLEGEGAISEKKMFGGLSFLYNGKMSVGVVKDGLVARVVAEKYEGVLEREHVRKMDFTGRVMKEFVYIEEQAFRTDAQLREWIDLGIEHAIRKGG